MIALDFVTCGVAAPADDTLTTLFDGVAARGYMACALRTDGMWRVTLGMVGASDEVYMATDARLDVALGEALAHLPKETARV